MIMTVIKHKKGSHIPRRSVGGRRLGDIRAEAQSRIFEEIEESQQRSLEEQRAYEQHKLAQRRSKIPNKP